MKGNTKNQLIAVIVVAIIAVIATWYITLPRQQYNKLATLQSITFSPPPPPSTCSPPCGPGVSCVGGQCTATPPPIFTFTFSGAVDPDFVKGTTAVLKSFALGPGTSAATAAAATELIGALLAKGGVPFAPVLATPTTITSNSMPATLLGVGIPPASFTGSGEMWFAVPMTKAAV